MKKTKLTLAAETRKIKGKKVKRLRKKGWIPATVYGKGTKSLSVQIREKELDKVWQEVGESQLIDLKIDDKEAGSVLLRNPQYGVLGNELIHIDCFKPDLTKKIRAIVPIILTGESASVKEGNVLVEVSNELEVEALPVDLPEHFEVDISALDEVEKMITVADLAVDKEKIEILAPQDQVIVKTEEPKEEEVVEAPAAEEKVEDEETVETEEGKEEEAEESKKKEEETEQGEKEK